MASVSLYLKGFMGRLGRGRFRDRVLDLGKEIFLGQVRGVLGGEGCFGDWNS